jgi:hypothetical protein
MKRLALVLILTAATSTTAQAQCTVTARGDSRSIRFAQSLAANSDSPEVRQAYVHHQCNIRKVEHGGGRPCRSGMPLDQVTIRVFGTATYHVFPERLGDGHFCTTP